jgi:uncharacterized protein YjeT (DUF2065 family)
VGKIAEHLDPPTRALAGILGVGAVMFGAAPALAPGFFGRMFGIASASDPTVATAIRSVGVRDMVVGVGILRALRAGDQRSLGEWLLARAACDAGDTLAVTVAVASGARNPGFLALGGLALGAAILGAALARATLRVDQPLRWPVMARHVAGVPLLRA